VFNLIVAAASTDPLADLKAGRWRWTRAIRGRGRHALPVVKRLPSWPITPRGCWRPLSSNRRIIPRSETLEGVWKQAPPSPLAARAFLLAGRAYLAEWRRQGRGGHLKKNYAVLAQPQGDLAMASAFAGAGDPVSAAIYNQRVYYGYPNSAEAAQADAESIRLRAQLGDNYPPAMPNAMLGRALKLLASGHALELARSWNRSFHNSAARSATWRACVSAWRITNRKKLFGRKIFGVDRGTLAGSGRGAAVLPGAVRAAAEES